MTTTFDPVAPGFALTHWGLTLIASHPPRRGAQVFDVTQSDGSPAILKIYRGEDLGYEGHAPAFYNALDGKGSIRLLGRCGTALLLEKQEGPALTTLAEAGRDDDATDILIRLAAHTAQTPCTDPAIRDLRERYKRLISKSPPPIRETALPAFRRAQDLAGQLIDKADGVETVLLHGDLHHENVLDGARGWLMIDPIVIRGVAEAEFAQVFRNPDALGTQLAEPGLAMHRARHIAARTGFPAKRLLAWGVVKCAHSLALNAGAPEIAAREARILDALLAAYDPL